MIIRVRQQNQNRLSSSRPASTRCTIERERPYDLVTPDHAAGSVTVIRHGKQRKQPVSRVPPERHISRKSVSEPEGSAVKTGIAEASVKPAVVATVTVFLFANLRVRHRTLKGESIRVKTDSRSVDLDPFLLEPRLTELLGKLKPGI